MQQCTPGQDINNQFLFIYSVTSMTSLFGVIQYRKRCAKLPIDEARYLDQKVQELYI